MEQEVLEELSKNIQWLIAERRKDKQLITDLQSEISGLVVELNKQKSLIKPLENELKRVSQNAIRPDEFTDAIATQKLEFSQGVLEVEKKFDTLERKFDKQHKDDMEGLGKRFLELQNEIKPLAEIKKAILSRTDDEFRVNQKIEEFSRQFQDYKFKIDELKQTQKMVDDSGRIEKKQLTEFQIELASLRKKLEEEIVSNDSQSESYRKLDQRLNELQVQEQIRKQDQITFVENISRQQVAHEGLLKEWESRVNKFENLGTDLQARIFDLDLASRNLTQSRDEFEELRQRLDRRVNEITEMNRLSEEHFKDEWVAFKADDQKRWTNYSLMVEELNRERNREITKLQERLAKVEDAIQSLIDSIELINEETEKRLKQLLVLSNESMTSFEQSMGKRK